MKYFPKDRLSELNIHYDNYTLDYFLDAMAELEISNVELLAGHQGVWADAGGFTEPKALLQKLRERELRCPIITPENCCYAYEIDVKEPLLREKTYAYFANVMRLGKELGAGFMEVNAGRGYWNESPEEARKRAADMLYRLAELAETLDMTLVCESLRPQETIFAWTLPQMKLLYDMVDHPRFKMMIDTTAMCVAGETIDQWFDVFGRENILHTHFQDCDPYGHRIWGEGTQELNGFLKALYDNGYQGLLSQELTVRDYYKDPMSYDRRNVANLRQYLY